MRSLRERLSDSRPLWGTQTFLGSPIAAEILGGAGFDFIFIDFEHVPFGLETLYAVVSSCESAGTPALVRMPEFDRTLTKKVADMGPGGLLFPMVKTAEEARAIMRALLYPPAGNRGFGPMRAVRWGMDDEAAFAEMHVQKSVRMIQIEHKETVANLSEIMRDPFIDAYIFGPNDLAASMGHICDVFHPQVQQEIRQAVRMLKDAGKRVGVSTVSDEPAVLHYWRDMGMDIFSCGGDTAFIKNKAARLLSILQQSEDTACDNR